MRPTANCRLTADLVFSILYAARCHPQTFHLSRPCSWQVPRSDDAPQADLACRGVNWRPDALRSDSDGRLVTRSASRLRQQLLAGSCHGLTERLILHGTLHDTIPTR